MCSVAVEQGLRGSVLVVEFRVFGVVRDDGRVDCLAVECDSVIVGHGAFQGVYGVGEGGVSEGDVFVVEGFAELREVVQASFFADAGAVGGVELDDAVSNGCAVGLVSLCEGF